MAEHFIFDGQQVAFAAGQTIMDAALDAGIYIPHLCHHPELVPSGNCRLCIVQVDNHYRAACITPASAGQQVRNTTEELTQLRRTLLQMLFVEGNHLCPGCEASGACELQALGYYTGMLSPHFTHFYPQRKVDASHPQVLIDFNRCILCGLCVRASRDVDGKHIFAISGRGIEARLVVNSASGKLGDTNLELRDKAVHVCPVGAILIRHRGFEVPLGERLYDQGPISGVGDLTARRREGQGRGK
jgi:[NiFe] hydrogenase diaphorase moiety small subunit